MIRFITIFLFSICSLSAQANGTQDIYRFFNKVQRYHAQFAQVTLDDAKKPVQESSGNLWIERPGKFRWDYAKPYLQQIVSDGKKVWVYDVELKQVTVRSLRGALGASPAILLAGEGNLETVFTIQDLGHEGDLDWVQLKPKKKDAGFDDLRIAFDKGKIHSLDMVDGFGQTTHVTMQKAEENGPISADKFNFTPPAGVDVITE